MKPIGITPTQETGRSSIEAYRAITWYESQFLECPYKIPVKRPIRALHTRYRDGRIQVSIDDPRHPTMQALEEFYESADPPF